MKKRRIIKYIVGVAVFLLTACNSEQEDVSEVLADDARRSEIMDSICNNPVMMRQMMDHMMGNERAMNMMMDNTGMMEQMMNDQHMMRMMEENHDLTGTMMNQMMQMMAGDSIICRDMQELMMQNKHMKSMMTGVCAGNCEEACKDGRFNGNGTMMHHHGMMN